MRIIREGKTPDHNWWVGRVCQCNNCDTALILEKEDNVIWCNDQMNGVAIYCPTKGCNTMLYTYKIQRQKT